MSYQESFSLSQKNVIKFAHFQCFDIPSFPHDYSDICDCQLIPLVCFSFLGWHFSEAGDLRETSEIHFYNQFLSFHFLLTNVCCLCFSLKVLVLYGGHRNNKVAFIFAVLTTLHHQLQAVSLASLIVNFILHVFNKSNLWAFKNYYKPQLILLQFCDTS